MPERFIVVDQNLRDFAGHHYDYSLSIARAAAARGLRVGIAVHEDFAGATLDKAPVVGRFSRASGAAPRGRFRETARGLFARMPRALRTQLLALAPEVSTDTVPPMHLGFAREFLALMAGLGLDTRDHVLIHTVDISEFLGLAEVLRLRPPIAPMLHIVLRYDGVPAHREAFCAIAATAHRVRYWTDTEPLASQYRELGCSDIGVLPIPHSLGELPRRRFASRHPLTLGYLGGARGDKGFHLLPDMVDRLVSDGTAPEQVRFLIQATFGVSREEGRMDAALRRLKRQQGACVELLETPPDAAGFLQALIATDILLLPYDRKIYCRRSSGLLVQAMALGIPTVVPANTWLSSVAPAGAHVKFETEALFVEAVRHAVRSESSLRSHAASVAKHPSSDTVDELIVRMI